MKTAPTRAEQQRAFRKKHAPAHPSYVGIWLREGDAQLLAAGLISDSLRQTAVEAIKEFWTDDEADAADKKASA